MDKLSFTAASTIPAKLFMADDTAKEVLEHRIKPIHVQTNVTNKCPLKCTFCSCANMDRNASIIFDLLKDISQKLIDLGARAFTNTGGGDPLAYDHLEAYFDFLKERGMDIALVTNGVLFKNYVPTAFQRLTWCRISLSDERAFRPAEIDSVIKACNVDWSFSYVLLKKVDIANLIRAIEYANENNFSHIRVVDDIIGGSNTMEEIKETLRRHQVDTCRVIWQGRKDYSLGNKQCLMSLLKPNVDVYGNLAACCGVQYASDPPMLDFVRRFRTCGPEAIEKTYETQACFDGSGCRRCYYSDYNNVLNAIWNAGNLKHGNFK